MCCQGSISRRRYLSLLLLEFNCEKTKAGEDVLSGLYSFDLNQPGLNRFLFKLYVERLNYRLTPVTSYSRKRFKAEPDPDDEQYAANG